MLDYELLNYRPFLGRLPIALQLDAGKNALSMRMLFNFHFSRSLLQEDWARHSLTQRIEI